MRKRLQYLLLHVQCNRNHAAHLAVGQNVSLLGSGLRLLERLQSSVGGAIANDVNLQSIASRHRALHKSVHRLLNAKQVVISLPIANDQL